MNNRQLRSQGAGVTAITDSLINFDLQLQAFNRRPELAVFQLPSTMQINVLAFGIARQIIGKNSIGIAAPEGMNAGELKSLLGDLYPELNRLKSFMLAVNGAYAGNDMILYPNDELAIIPPVSGG